jgi:transposase
MLPEAIIEGYSKQQTVERGFRFLKDPIFFTSSLFVKKASRIESLLMVMSLALMVYATAERRLRRNLKDAGATIPNQIKQPTANPTLRWVFQLFHGVHCARVNVNEQTKLIWHGLTEIRKKILRLLGEKVTTIYQIEAM